MAMCITYGFGYLNYLTEKSSPSALHIISHAALKKCIYHSEKAKNQTRGYLRR